MTSRDQRNLHHLHLERYTAGDAYYAMHCLDRCIELNLVDAFATSGISFPLVIIFMHIHCYFEYQRCHFFDSLSVVIGNSMF